ncbi:MAG: hypothetical protein ACI9JM_000474 [Halioglobus sp.]|jgi:hypothetical protein
MTSVSQNAALTEVEVSLGFSRPEEVTKDHEGRDLNRATTRPVDGEFSDQFEYRRCLIRDLTTVDEAPPNILTMGFESIDLSPHPELQSLLAQLRQEGKMDEVQAKALRRHLTGQVFPLAGGKCLKMLFIAPEGLIMRAGGPNGLKIDHHEQDSQVYGQDVALAVHGDQDVRGTPLKQMMHGVAPWLFRHKTPDGNNNVSPMMLVNLWIPLHQLTRPLCLMDRRSLNGREHQLRYGLPTDSFLDRNEDMKVNDIWTFLHDPSQQWYFHSKMDHEQAYIFDTLGEAHGSVILPGEEVAEYYYLKLKGLREQLESGGITTPATDPAPELPADTTAALREAVSQMSAVEGRLPQDSADESVKDLWLADAAIAMESVVRQSLEMRVVAVLLPDVWPFNKAAAL